MFGEQDIPRFDFLGSDGAFGSFHGESVQLVPFLWRFIKPCAPVFNRKVGVCPLQFMFSTRLEVHVKLRLAEFLTESLAGELNSFLIANVSIMGTTMMKRFFCGSGCNKVCKMILILFSCCHAFVLLFDGLRREIFAQWSVFLLACLYSFIEYCISEDDPCFFRCG